MKKALIITTVSGFVPQFELNNVKILQSMGYEVHYAANFHTPVYTDNNDRLIGTRLVLHQIDFVRSPFKMFQNMLAYWQLKTLMREKTFDLIHCHTPMGGVLGRLAAKVTNTRNVIYTAHGFHFYKGAPLLNWLIFYPVERYLARYTDVLITINREDEKRAEKFHLRKSGKLKRIYGIGIDSIQYQSNKRIRLAKRKELGIGNEDFIWISVGELTKRKNHTVIIKAMKAFQNQNVHYVICGTGKKQNELEHQIHRLHLEDQVHLLGYRNDIPELLDASDGFLFPSLQEGLPVALLEAMSAKKPILASKIRGNIDLLQGSHQNLVSKNRVTAYIYYMKKIMKNPKCKDWENNLKCYKKKYVIRSMYEIYLSLEKNNKFSYDKNGDENENMDEEISI